MMKLYRFDYSCYARKVQMLLDLLGDAYEVIEVPYGNRKELAKLTGGYIQVPVLIDDQGKAWVDSKKISQFLLSTHRGKNLVPESLAHAVWDYADWCDGLLEDVLFRIATPGISRRFQDEWERALFLFIKERKFGVGCVKQWEEEQNKLILQAQILLAPTLEKLKKDPFIFGGKPTLADAALYGQLAMLETADRQLPETIFPKIKEWMERLKHFIHPV